MKRINKGIDVSRLARAVSYPGIDPRVWVSLATVTAFHVDPVQGVFADVFLMPLGAQATARVGAVYAGNGFGFYAPLKIDDEIIVMAPSGDMDEGLVVVSRLWSAADPPPSEAASSSDEIILHIEDNKVFRIIVGGTGKMVIEARDSATIMLGDDGLELNPVPQSSTNGIVTGTGIDPFTGSTYAVLGNASTKVAAKT
jgi:hypothetical protein